MNHMSCAVEIGLSGLGFDETLIQYVRRCCTRAESGLGRRFRWQVELASKPGRDEVDVTVCGFLGSEELRPARARDLDGMLAVRNAFARFEAGARVRQQRGSSPPPMDLAAE